jgi:hypothetical protein
MHLIYLQPSAFSLTAFLSAFSLIAYSKKENKQ